MSAILQVLSRFGPGRLAAMGAVTLALIGFFAFVIVRVSQPTMGVLFTELSASDAGAIMRELDARAVKYESRDEGATLLAPKADLPRLRMDLAGKSLPSGGGVGYEIFDKGDAFSSTSFVQGINQLRALEGELARTIRTIGRVQAARVHLAIPEKRLFERDREPPRASIVLKVRGELGGDQVQAIRHLVASAVQGLAPDRISMVDERGRLLADGSGGDRAAMTAVVADDKRVALERRLRTQVEELVAGIVGPGRARVQVAAELDLNRVENRSETFDPEGRVVRSSQLRGETSSTTGGDGPVSVGNELPGARDGAGASPAARDNSTKNEEVTNYEISKTTRTEVLEAGRVKRLSVAVLLDGAYAKGPNGEAVYKARSAEDLDRIAALVRSAVGFDKARGDLIEVVNLPFAETAPALGSEPASLIASLFSPSREDILRFIELGIIALLTLVVLLLVVRPMVKKVIAPEGPLGPALAFAGMGPNAPETAPSLAAAAGASALAAEPSRPASLPDGTAAAAAPALAAGGGPALPPSWLASPAELVQAIMAPGLSPAEQVAKLGEMARANPKDAANILRGWLGER